MGKEFQKEEMLVCVKKKKNYVRNLKINRIQLTQGFLGGSDGKESACQCRTPGFHSLGWEDSPGGGNDNPTPVFLPGESHGRSSLVGHTESDTTEQLTLGHTFK